MKIYLPGIALLLLGFSLPSVAQETPISLSEVQAQVKANNAKLTSGAFEMMKVTATDDQFFPEMPGSIRINKSLINGKTVAIFRDTGRFAGDKEVDASDVSTVEMATSASTRSTMWTDGANKNQTTLYAHSEGIDQNGQVMVEGGGQEFVRVEPRRTRSVLPDLLVGPNAMTIGDNCVVKGKTLYKGIECIELAQTNAENDFRRRILVCPACGYRIVFSEAHATFKADDGTSVENVQTTAVEKIKKYGDMWIPTQIRSENTKMQAGKPPLSQVSKIQVLNFRPNMTPEEMAFEPLIVPGTLVLDGAKMSFAVNDIQKLVKQLRAGDLSFLDADKSDTLIDAP